MLTEIGKDRHLVRFENPGAPVPDPGGGFTETWEPASPPDWYVSIRPATVRDLENEAPGSVQARATHIVHGRWHSGISTGTRMLFEGRILFVNGKVNPEERKREMALFCEERL